MKHASCIEDFIVSNFAQRDLILPDEALASIADIAEEGCIREGLPFSSLQILDGLKQLRQCS